jgi:hypothetical protein
MTDFESLGRLAEAVSRSILAAPPIRIFNTLNDGLEEMKTLVVGICNNIDKSSRPELEAFKEKMHGAYAVIADALKPGEFTAQQLYEIPLIVYRRMLVTTQECINLTGYPFDKGFEYANLSVSEIGLGNYEASFSHLELARIEDDRIGHETGVAKSNLENVVFENAYVWAAHMTSQFTIQHVRTMCKAKLDWTEICRFAKAMWKSQFRIADHRSSLNNEDLERNLVNICKIVESYLKRRHPLPETPPHKQTLRKLIEYAFSSHSWYKNWTDFVQYNDLDYADPKVDDMKLAIILTDESRSRQTNMFLALCIIRNFGTHAFNDESVLFLEKEYAIAFSMLVEALMYTIANI